MPKRSEVLKGVTVRLYPSNSQKEQLRQFLSCVRYVWNVFLYKNIRFHKKTKKFKFYHGMATYLTKHKRDKPFLKEAPSQVLQQTLKDLDQAMKSCFKSDFGFPKFKRRDGGSLRFPQGFKVKHRSILLPKLGHVQAVLPPFLKRVEVRNVTVFEKNGKFYASLCFKEEVERLPKTNKAIGLDVGTTHLATGSNGKHKKAFDKLPKVKALFDRIKNTQAKVDLKGFKTKIIEHYGKKKKVRVYSKSCLKAKLLLAKLHAKLKNMRKDYLHKFTSMLVRNYDVIIVEGLNIKGMTGNNKGTVEKPGKNRAQKKGLNRNILSNGWGMLFSFLEYKCSWYGKTFVKVNPKNTSQTCSKCGHLPKRNEKRGRLSQSEFVCRKCGFELNADHNAAINILARGLALV